MTAQATNNMFGSEYEQELEVWLQRRFRYLCFAFILVSGFSLLMRVTMGVSTLASGIWLITTAGSVASLVIVIYYLTLRNWKTASRTQILAHASRMILLLGAASLVTQVFMVSFGSIFDGSQMLFLLFFWHFTACLFLPWTPRESLRPLVPLMIIWAVCVLTFGYRANFFVSLLTVIFGTGVLIPGLGICSWRLSRHSQQFRREMVGRHFMSMRQELARARNIHESMFPKHYADPHVEFDYTYLPMRELGGDFIHLNVGAQGLVHVVLLDVTGHGLAAALTVNRLFGELERIRGELPFAEPDEVLILLNRYINLTLVRHNIYATAACMTIDPYLSELRWAAAGHPPGFLRHFGGEVTSIESTAVVLGALNDHDFSTELSINAIEPGDELVIYTDGVFEVRNRAGQQYGLDRLQKLLDGKPPPRNWPQFITSTIQKYGAGRMEDDILVASLKFISPRVHDLERDGRDFDDDAATTVARVAEKLK